MLNFFKISSEVETISKQFTNLLVENMKKIILPVLFISFFFAFYELSNSKPNVFIIVICFLLFMFGMNQLMFKNSYSTSDNIEENEVKISEKTIDKEDDNIIN